MFSLFLFLFSSFFFISCVYGMQLLLPCFQCHSSFSDNELGLCIRWPNYWSFSINPSNEHTGLLFLRIPLRLIGLISLLSKEPQHHNSKASIFWFSNFFMVQLSHPYMTTGKKWLLIKTIYS